MSALLAFAAGFCLGLALASFLRRPSRPEVDGEAEVLARAHDLWCDPHLIAYWRDHLTALPVTSGGSGEADG